MSEQHGMGRKRGPYGTNEGDTWTVPPDSPLQKRFDQDGEGVRVIVEMMVKEGVLQEAIYCTALPELIEKAEQGYELLAEALAARN